MYFVNSIWTVIVTIGTVGFGDLYPKSHLGRLVGIIICTWGVFIVSFFVVSINNLLTFNSNEEKAYYLLERLQAKANLKSKATLVLGAAFKLRNTKLKHRKNKEKVINATMNFRKNMIQF